jgi:hypothetical protein
VCQVIEGEGESGCVMSVWGKEKVGVSGQWENRMQVSGY